jgi:type III secretion HrpO family protein
MERFSQYHLCREMGLLTRENFGQKVFSRRRFFAILKPSMDRSLFIDFAARAMMLTLMLSLPSILLATAVGLGISLFQALTQIQEQTLSFTVKLIAITMALILTAHWMGTEVIRYTESIFYQIPLAGTKK